jgi:hypothetical protein
MRRFDLSFNKLLGKPCWNVKGGWGSFLTLEFGEPHLKIIEPRDSTSASSIVQKALGRRHIHVRGDWHLWLYCCDWIVSDESDVIVGDSSSKKRIDRAATFLNGQALSSAKLTPRGMRTIFEFDLGARLETKPYNRRDEQWSLYEPNGKVLSVRADKHYSYGESKRTPEPRHWLPTQTE